ncbi:P1 family peptidase [Brevibacterium otitidis]|uniref:P1 family peptidase n=1 Tax=Brevibacterium otitidis TaxID=53364 RepID=A0ABV5X696_9MICO|nr:hypothetical protein GCM10023233_16100 [Brevibacterium otitidis]
MAVLRRGRGILEIAGIEIGHAGHVDAEAGALTGTTMFVVPVGTVGGVDVRGGGPASHETELMAPGTLQSGPDAIVLSGGSAYGLVTASGVQAALAVAGRGFPAPGLPGVTVPLVPAASIFDLGRGGAPCLPPTLETGGAAFAARTAGPEAVVRGSVGGGLGAWTGRGLLRGGLGSAVIDTDTGHRVAAIVVANPMGTVISAAGRLHAAEVLAGYGIELPADATPELAERFAAVAAAAEQAAGGAGGDAAADRAGPGSAPGDAPGAGAPGAGSLNTTIAAVVTDAQLDAAQVHRLAQSAHAGLARAIHPSHTLFDGDTVFALATGATAVGSAGTPAGDAQAGAGHAQAGAGHAQASTTADPMVLAQLSIAAADALSAAIVDAVISAADYADGPPTPASPPPLQAVCPQLAAAWNAVD